jgi:predicted ATPase
VAEATLLIEESGERYYEAEIRRLEGALRLALGGADMIEVEALYRRALDIARSQQARSLALRAAFDLGQLWAQCGKRQQAHELLLQAYQGFTEGFDTADLLKAKRLLDELC